MRHVALLWMVAACAGAASVTQPARAACSQEPCIDAEPMWLPPASTRFRLVSDTTAMPAGKLAASAAFGFRLRPAVLTVPAPSRDGRDVNLLRYALDATFGLRWGLGDGLELTLVAPAGLYQRGAGIKGITSQNAPALPEQGLHDPRVGFGYALVNTRGGTGIKLRFEAKLPLGNADALGGEASPVASPSIAFRFGEPPGWRLRSALELGLRLRRPVDFYGSRVGSQAFVALALSLDLPWTLGLSLEGYLLPSVVARSSSRNLPGECLLSVRSAPESWRGLSVGVAGGLGLPYSETPTGDVLALGVPAVRTLAFATYAPGAD